MSKRKRHDSLCSSTNLVQQSSTPPLPPASTTSQLDGVTSDLGKDKAIATNCDNSETKRLECKKHEPRENNNVAPLAENVNIVNATPTPTSKDPPSSHMTKSDDNFNSRRKSNRILSLKRAVVPAVVSSPNSTSTEEQSSKHNNNGTPTPESNQKSNASNESASSFSTAPSSSDATQVSSSTPAQPSNNNSQTTQNKSRKIQVWTEDDTRWFFEALCEHGKDFPHIQSYIAARCEKKGIPSELIKNYEQVRHYYYRMWHKISQMLKISSVVEKGIQEIYGLINYGEIWKKFGSKIDARLSANLQQLVDFGYTVFKVKGKSVRVRTPVCNALKRIHNIDSKVASKPTTQPIPKEITVELLPETNGDWIRVHSLAQNPRLRTRLTMQHRLSTLISYLERRWSLARIKSNASNQVLGIDLFAPEEGASSLDADGTMSAACNSKKGIAIRLRPQNSEKLNEKVLLKSTSNSISVNSYRSITTANAPTDLSLSAYLKNLFAENGNGGGGVGGLLAEGKGKQHKMRKYSRKVVDKFPVAQAESTVSSSSHADEKTKENNTQKDTDDTQKEAANNDSYQALNLFKMLDSMNEELEVPLIKTGHGTAKKASTSLEFENELANDLENKETSDVEGVDFNFLKLCQPPDHTTLSQWLSGGGGGGDGHSEANENEKDEEEGSVTQSATNISPAELKGKSKRRGSLDAAGSSSELTLLTAKQARLGWKLKEAESVTIGELYLLFCCPSKIVLEYNFQTTEAELRECNESDNLDLSERATEKETPLMEVETHGPPVQSLLQQLLIAASITLSNLKKPTSTAVNLQLSTNSASSATTIKPTGGQTAGKSSRKRSSKSGLSPPIAQPQPSPLLSNLIQETILGDCMQKELVPSTTFDASNVVVHLPAKSVEQSLEINNSSLKEVVKEKEHFVAPKRPAPRANHPIQLKSGRPRNTAIIDDPSKVEEALNALKANKFRQRRPMQKPFMYNLQSKVFGPKNASLKATANGTTATATKATTNRSALFVIPTSHLASTAEGQTPKPILLTDLLPNHIPQASISISPVISPSITVNSFLATPASQLPKPPQHSMVIPLVENQGQKVSPISMVPPAQAVFQEPTTLAAEISKLQSFMSTYPALATVATSNSATLKEDSMPGQKQTASSSVVPENYVHKAMTLEETSNNGVPASDNANCSKHGTASEVAGGGDLVDHQQEQFNNSSNSQPSWLNEVNNEFSLGSLIAACDIVANEELQKTTTSENSLSINSDIETHINSMANDNSVDLMAKFEILAQQITADAKHKI